MDFDSLFGSHPLHEAVAQFDLEGAARLLDAGAQIDAEDQIGKTQRAHHQVSVKRHRPIEAAHSAG